MYDDIVTLLSFSLRADPLLLESLAIHHEAEYHDFCSLDILC